MQKENALMKTAFLALMALGLTACETPYQPLKTAQLGGVVAFPITNKIVRIDAYGAPGTNSVTIYDYSILKAAETTLEMGGTDFIVMEEPGYADKDLHSSVATRQPMGVHPEHFDQPTNPVRRTIRIKIFNVLKEPLPENTYNAVEIVKRIGERVRRG